MENNKYLNKLLLAVKLMEELALMPVDVKLSQTEFRMLREIVIEKELGKQIISSEISRRLGVTRSAVSQLVTKLEERGIVKRVASPTDRKIFYVELSDRAAAEFGTQWRKANEFVDRVVEEFGVENTDNLISTCEAFAKTLKSVRKEYFPDEKK